MGEFSGDAPDTLNAYACARSGRVPVADQPGHTLDVNQNVYTQSPVSVRGAAVDRLEKSLVSS